MTFDASETLFSMQALLWLAGSTIAAFLLFGSISRRRSHLTGSLRDYVERKQETDEKPRRKTTDDSTSS